MSNQLAALASIERRITYHIQGVYANILEVGRCLIEAKESGLVPHGQWEAWVQRVAGMSDRTAQRLMKAARDVAPDSAMAKLPLTKIQAILTLPAAEQEPMAQRAVDEDMSLRALQNEVAGLRRSLKKSEQAESLAKRQAMSAKKQLDDALAVNARVARNSADARMEVARLKEQLQEAQDKASTGISPEAQARIDALTAELADAEAMVDRQAELRQEAQQALVELKSQMDRGGAVRDQEDLTADAVIVAVRTFMGSAGYIPHSTALATLSEADRQTVAAHVEMIAQWAEAARQALSGSRLVVIGEA